MSIQYFIRSQEQQNTLSSPVCLLGPVMGEYGKMKIYNILGEYDEMKIYDILGEYDKMKICDILSCIFGKKPL